MRSIFRQIIFFEYPVDLKSHGWKLSKNRQGKRQSNSKHVELWQKKKKISIKIIVKNLSFCVRYIPVYIMWFPKLVYSNTGMYSHKIHFTLFENFLNIYSNKYFKYFWKVLCIQLIQDIISIFINTNLFGSNKHTAIGATSLCSTSEYNSIRNLPPQVNFWLSALLYNTLNI